MGNLEKRFTQWCERFEMKAITFEDKIIRLRESMEAKTERLRAQRLEREARARERDV